MGKLVGTKVIEKKRIIEWNRKTKRVQQNGTIEWLVKQREYGGLL